MRFLLLTLCLIACAAKGHALQANAIPPPTIVQFVNQTNQVVMPPTGWQDPPCWVSTNPPYPLDPGQTGEPINVTASLANCNTPDVPWVVVYSSQGSTICTFTLQYLTTYTGASAGNCSLAQYVINDTQVWTITIGGTEESNPVKAKQAAPSSKH